MKRPMSTQQAQKAQPETIIVHQVAVPCDGGNGALGHPRVFLAADHDGVTCPYCSRTYKLAEGASAHGH